MSTKHRGLQSALRSITDVLTFEIMSRVDLIHLSQEALTGKSQLIPDGKIVQCQNKIESTLCEQERVFAELQFPTVIRKRWMSWL